MASLAGKTIQSTYKDLLQVSNSNSGVDGSLKAVEDGEGTSSALQISTSGVKSSGTLTVTGDGTFNNQLIVPDCMRMENGGDAEFFTGVIIEKNHLEIFNSDTSSVDAVLGHDSENALGGIIMLKSVTNVPSGQSGYVKIYSKVADDKLYYRQGTAERELLTNNSTINANTVTTNANLTGHVTSVGNAAVLGSFSLAQLNTALSDATLGGSIAEGDVPNLPASKITSGTFADARISASSVTQHQGSLSIASSQIASGTLADARIAASNVTQHQASLSIGASQVGSGTFADARIAASNVTQHAVAKTGGTFTGNLRIGSNFGSDTTPYDSNSDSANADFLTIKGKGGSTDDKAIIELASPNATVADIVGEIHFVNRSSDANFNPKQRIVGHYNQGLQIYTKNSNSAEVLGLQVNNLAQVKLGAYGSGSYTGTATKWLAVDSSGNIIEQVPPGGGGLIVAGSGSNPSIGLGDGVLAADSGATQGNVAIGHDSLKAINPSAGGEGEFNVGIGDASLDALDRGSHNVAIGYFTATAGNGVDFDDNVAIGSQAMANHTTGAYRNVAIGTRAYSGQGGATNGRKNVFIGYDAGWESGSTNTVGIGYQSMKTGDGDDCTAVGPDSLYWCNGSNVTGIGNYAGRTGSPSGKIEAQSNIIVLGNNSVTDIYCADTTISSSDSRDKADITDFTHGLDWITKLRPVTYKWDKRTDYRVYDDDGNFVSQGTPDGTHKKSRLNIGLLAQEHLEVEKSFGYGNNKDDMLVTSINEDETAYGLKYERLVPILINAVKELEKRIKDLENA